ncbi:MAG TPA: hypothetical protein VGI88_04780, partial [Verrucomicrobiae bacterium]
IRKDKVADINISAPKKDTDSKAKQSASVEPAAPTSMPIVPAVLKEPASANSPSAGDKGAAHDRSSTSTGATSSAASFKADLAAPKAKAVAAAQIPPPTVTSAASAGAAAAALPTAPTPPPAPEPVVIRDEIRGNQYVNVTYGFQMYKPPSWQLIPAARKELPDAVAALGTLDQTTLLVIGREHAKDSLDVHAAKTGKALGDVYENYRQISSRQLSVAGFPAVEQHARGTADGRDWSVTLLTLVKGGDAYTLLGMTWADSDLIQVQENVIAKAVNSLTFVAP